MSIYFAASPKGLENLLLNEFKALGASNLKETVAGVHFSADQATLYRICLNTRLASRILMPVAQFQAKNTDELYQFALKFNWQQHMELNDSFAIDCSIRGRSAFEHSKFASLKLKDAIADYFREKTGRRPDVERDDPDHRFNLFIHNEEVSLSIDMGGGSLHQRAYRLDTGSAPLKENLAAALLMRSRWPENFAKNALIVDPMCGSGTLLIEALFLKLGIAPNLERPSFGFESWRGTDQNLWHAEYEKACAQREAAIKEPKVLAYGYDFDGRVLDRAKDNIERAGLSQFVQLRKRKLNEWREDSFTKDCRAGQTGLVITNPPYGERMGELSQIGITYQELGNMLRQTFTNWQAAVLTSNPALGKQMGIRAKKKNKFFNGSLECELLFFDLQMDSYVTDRNQAGEETRKLSAASEQFKNRLAKNFKHIAKWAKRNQVECYRIYDADLPDFNVAIDMYRDHIVVQEYRAPPEISEQRAQERLNDVLQIAPGVLQVDRERMALKTRAKQKGKNQYERKNQSESFFTIKEDKLEFAINIFDYLDTGIFLDHRSTRKMIREMAEGKDFLNLFCYTGTVSVYAAAGGAKSTTSVDMSRTYIEWAHRNLELNNLHGPKNLLLQEDCLEWLADCEGQYDLIFLDPPTFSNSKRMEDNFAVQEDYLDLFEHCKRILRDDGQLVFSNNFRKFKMDQEAVKAMGFSIENISHKTLPQDFKRNPRIHNAWLLTKN